MSVCGSHLETAAALREPQKSAFDLKKAPASGRDHPSDVFLQESIADALTLMIQMADEAAFPLEILIREQSSHPAASNAGAPQPSRACH